MTLLSAISCKNSQIVSNMKLSTLGKNNSILYNYIVPKRCSNYSTLANIINATIHKAVECEM